MSNQKDPCSDPPSAARGIAGQIVANTSLLIAVLVYMGWAYDEAFFGYFNLNPLGLGLGIIEFMLGSLSLFSPMLVIAAVILIFVTAARTWDLSETRLARLVALIRRLVPGKPSVIGAGAIVTAVAVVLAWKAGSLAINPYVVLGLLGTGSLLLAWPTRADSHGRFPYALAVVVAAVCALWAASLYATNLGIRRAQQVVSHLPARTAVALYTIQPIALSGPGVTVQHLRVGSMYHYRYEGLRLLTARSGTYYLLPVRWSPTRDPTYVIDESNQTRIELY